MEIKTGEIVVFKLTSTEEVIGRVVDKLDGYYTIKNPVALMYQQQGEKVGVGFAPFMPYAKGEVHPLNTSTLLSWGEPDEQLYNEYVRVTSGIQLTP